MTLAEEYFEAEARQATVTHDFHESDFKPGDDILYDESNISLAFIIPNILTDEECDEVIQLGENYGYTPPLKAAGTLRTAKRTLNYQNKELSEYVTEKVRATMQEKLPLPKDGMGEFYGLHENWRLLRYDPTGDSFCAHQDQMDSIQKTKPDGSKEFIVSSHTLLINLSKEGVVGGATRFYPKSKVKTLESGQYDDAVDVRVPRGWGLVFRQKGLIHAGQPVWGEMSKYVAQTGVLRLLPPKKVLQPNVFRLGPGLTEFSDQRREELVKEACLKKYKPLHTKYLKMLKVGLPLNAIKNTMVIDGVNPDIVHTLQV